MSSTTIDLKQPNTSTGEENLAGSGTQGQFTFRLVKAADFQVAGGTGRFQGATGVITLTEAAVPVLSDAAGNPVSPTEVGSGRERQPEESTRDYKSAPLLAGRRKSPACMLYNRIKVGTFLLNGRAVATEGYSPQTTLLEFLRSQGLTGAKEGCAEGECGACTVLVVRPHGEGSAYVPVNSCLLFLPMLEGQEVYTVESLAQGGELCEVQHAMAEAGGSQCGYCTPGFVMSLFAEQYRTGREGPCDPHSMGGNLCRCTGYRPIRDAALSLGPAPAGEFRQRLDRPAPLLGSAEAPGFARPATLGDYFALLEEHSDARLIAGGTDLAVESNLRQRRFPFVISLEGLEELRVFEDRDDEVELGAGLTLSEIGRVWTASPAVWQEWLPLFASPLIRNRATLGGNLATASPIGDGAPLLLAMDAAVKIASAEGVRMVPLDRFFRGYRKTALRAGELLLSVVLPKPFPAMARFFKAAKRRMDDISTVAACFAIDQDDAGRIRKARFAYGGVAAVPLRAVEAEDAVLGMRFDEEACRRAQEVLARTLRPISDHRGSAAYRVALTQSLLRKFWMGTEGEPARARAAKAPRRLTPAHESARGHVTGEALYTDDLVDRFPRALHAWPVLSPHAHARVLSLDLAPALEEPGVVTTIPDPDVTGEVKYHQQAVAWVLGESLEAAQRGAARVRAEYEPLPAILTIDDAIAAGSFLSGPHTLRRPGDGPPPALTIRGELHIGGQEHFYLETQCALAWLDESGGVAVHSSTQHPSETQEAVAHALHIPSHKVTVECLRMGGAFGGKEVQANSFAAIAALGAWKTKRPVRVRLPRVLDMALTGKRHPFLARFEAGFYEDGRLEHVAVKLYSDGGWSLDLSDPVLWRAMFHVDNAYFLPSVEITGHVCRTNKTSQTAFRGFGGPQGMVVIEDILARGARALGLQPEVVRERNFYREGDTTHYGQPVKDAARVSTIWRQLLETSGFHSRRAEIDRWNAGHPDSKRGIAITPVKFGISFTATFFNQGGALVLIYRDGSVQVNHGGTEMGQGLHTKIRRIAAESLGVAEAAIRIMPTRTDKVPNTSASAASASTDLNGAAVQDACRQLRDRLAPIAGAMLGCAPEAVRFAGGFVSVANDQVQRFPFGQVAEAAYRQRLPLFAEGYYRTPGIHFDQKAGRGHPFHYFAYGAAVSEVEVDGFTGDARVLRTDILEDVGDSVAPLIDLGQIEGGYIQGLGWLTIEELLWDSEGRLASNGASTYKLPSWSELPEVFHVAFLERATEPGVIFGSKAVGEPPLMLAISAREAIRDAIAAFGPGGVATFDSPATPERIFWAVQEARQQAPVEELQQARSGRMTIDALNALSREEFVDALGWVFEHSPWVAERAWDARPFTTVETLHAAMQEKVEAAGQDEKMALLVAHPDLGTRARLTAASQSEQAGAGLVEGLGPDESTMLLQLNTEYRERFGIPFIYAVKGSGPQDILFALTVRMNNTFEEEFHEALYEVYRIAFFRLGQVIDQPSRS